MLWQKKQLQNMKQERLKKFETLRINQVLAVFRSTATRNTETRPSQLRFIERKSIASFAAFQESVSGPLL